MVSFPDFDRDRSDRRFGFTVDLSFEPAERTDAKHEPFRLRFVVERIERKILRAEGRMCDAEASDFIDRRDCGERGDAGFIGGSRDGARSISSGKASNGIVEALPFNITCRGATCAPMRGLPSLARIWIERVDVLSRSSRIGRFKVRSSKSQMVPAIPRPGTPAQIAGFRVNEASPVSSAGPGS